jgi:signal transduction histidine kinase
VLEGPLRRHGIALDTAFGLGDCAIQANRAQVQQVATNLVVNAIEALAGAGPRSGMRRIQVSTYRYNEDMVEIAVADNGPGIPPADRARIFERLYSTKPGNTGMGLALSLAIARAHGGALAVEDYEPHGARFRLRLPLRPSLGA